MFDVSFIIPVFNVSSYLDEFIQAFSHCNIQCEIIFVNDGSTDNSLSIILKYAQVDNRIIVLNKKNGGVSSARNYGIINARGRYIACLDPDDIISPLYFKYLHHVFHEGLEFDTLIYSYRKFEDGVNIYNLGKDFDETNIQYVDIRCLFLLHNYPWLRLVRRDFFVNNLFPENIIYEDSVTVPLLNSQANHVLKINEVLYYYRVRNSSLTNNNLIRNIDMLAALELLKLKSENINSKRASYCYFSCVAHLSRSALVFLSKISESDANHHKYRFFAAKIFYRFKGEKVTSVLFSGASLIDKVCFLIIRTGVVGVFVFTRVYSLSRVCFR